MLTLKNHETMTISITVKLVRALLITEIRIRYSEKRIVLNHVTAHKEEPLLVQIFQTARKKGRN